MSHLGNSSTSLSQWKYIFALLPQGLCVDSFPLPIWQFPPHIYCSGQYCITLTNLSSYDMNKSEQILKGIQRKFLMVLVSIKNIFYLALINATCVCRSSTSNLFKIIYFFSNSSEFCVCFLTFVFTACVIALNVCWISLNWCYIALFLVNNEITISLL